MIGTTTSTGPRCPPSFELERMFAGEAIGLDVAAHVDGCGRCTGQLEELQTGSAAFLLQRPAAAFVAALEARRPTRPLLRWSWAALAAPAMAAILLLAVRPEPEPPAVRLKGSPFAVHYNCPHQERSGLAADGQLLHPGDSLRFSYSATTNGYLAILGRDGAGQAMTFHPYGQREPARVEAGEGGWLAGSVVLDEAPGPERLTALFATEPFDLASAVARLQAGEDAGACATCVVETLRLEKKR
jgi:hypothetical protein